MSKNITSNGEKVEQVISIHDSNEVTADVRETQVRFQICSKSQESILIGSDSGNSKMYTYLTEQAAKLYAEIPQFVKGCVHTANILLDRNSASKDSGNTSEKGGYLTTSAKCLSDSGSDSSISNVTQGMISLGLKNTHIHTAIGTEGKGVEEMKISLLDNCGVVQNI